MLTSGFLLGAFDNISEYFCVCVLVEIVRNKASLVDRNVARVLHQSLHHACVKEEEVYNLLHALQQVI